MYPNPANETLRLHIDVAEKKEVIVINALGAMINQYPMPDKELEINVSSWPKGIYFVMAYRRGQLLDSKRLVKN